MHTAKILDDESSIKKRAIKKYKELQLLIFECEFEMEIDAPRKSIDAK